MNRLKLCLIGVVCLGLTIQDLPAQSDTPEAFTIMDSKVPIGTTRRIDLIIGENFTGDELPIPVFVIHGRKKGPVVCLAAGIHGDEVNGIEIVRRTVASLRWAETAGTVIAIPIINLPGYLRGMRYLPDRRDLNRYFPGRKTGSSASRIAFRVFEQVIKKCDFLVDYHTGSLKRTNIPQVRGNFRNTKIKSMATAFGVKVAVHKPGGLGTLRWAAVRSGIPAIIYEAGAPTRFDEQKIREGLAGTQRLLAYFGIAGQVLPVESPPVFFEYTYWVRAERGGIMLASVRLGQKVKKGDLLARIADPFKEASTEVRADKDGMVIGMAYNQVVMPGFALFHIGTDQPIPAPDPATEPSDPAPDDEQPGSPGETGDDG